MSGVLRALILAVSVFVGVFLSMGTWYWSQFRQTSGETVQTLKKAIPALTPLLQQQADEKVSSLIDQLPFKLIIADQGRVVITSNLASTDRQRREKGQQWLDQQLMQDYASSEDQFYRFYYQAPFEWWDPQLLFPLAFALLLALLTALWDVLHQRQLEDQTDALILLNQNTASEELEELESENAQLKNKLSELQRENQTLEQTLEKAQQAAPAAVLPVVQLSGAANTPNLTDSKEHQSLLQQTKQQAVEIQALELRLEALGQELLQKQQAFEQELQGLESIQAEKAQLAQELEAVTERNTDLEQQTGQLHEAWGEIESLRKEQTAILQKQEKWQKEKQRILSLMYEKDEQNKQLRERLKTTRAKVRELSLAYKKELEKVLHLPDDIQEVARVLAALIEEKDLVEHENVRLHLEQAEKLSEIQRLRLELQVRAERLEHARRLIEEMAGNLQANQRELALLSETLEDKLLDLDRIKDLHDEDQQVMEGVLQERDQLRLLLDERERQLGHLKHERAELMEQKSALELQLAGMDLEAHQLEVEQLRQSLKLMGMQQKRRAETIEDLKGKLKEGEGLYARLKKHAENQEADIRRLQQEISRHRSEIQILEAKLKP